VPEPLNALRAGIGLDAIDRLWDSWREMAVLCTSIAELDPLAGETPSEVEYVGPVFEQVPPSGWHPPWPHDDERPLVLVSFSTDASQDPRSSRIRRTLAGLARMPYRVLVTSSNADVSGLEVPENAVVVQHIPHGDVLPMTAATVTHAGHGTIAASLAHGVPLVCLPIPRIADQPPLAAHLERLGAGRTLDGEAATAAEIAAATQDVLADSSYRVNALELAQVIAATSGAVTAANRLEQLAERVGSSPNE
jgi:MGT family glycosyltransferase